MGKHDWKVFLRQAGAAYAAIVLSIVGINIPTGDQALPKKASEHRVSPEAASDETAAKGS